MMDITQEWRKHEHCLRAMQHSELSQEPAEDKIAVFYWFLNYKRGSSVPQKDSEIQKKKIIGLKNFVKQNSSVCNAWFGINVLA